MSDEMSEMALIRAAAGDPRQRVDARAVLSTQHRNPQHDAASQVLLAQQVSGRQEEGTRNGCGAAPTSALAPIAAAGPVGG